MQTRKTCRILAETEKCGGICLYRLGDGNIELTTGNKSAYGYLCKVGASNTAAGQKNSESCWICQEKRREWRDEFGSCFRKKGTGYEGECRTECGGVDYARVTQWLRDGLTAFARLGQRDPLRDALQKSCTSLACLAPCQVRPPFIYCFWSSLCVLKVFHRFCFDACKGLG